MVDMDAVLRGWTVSRSLVTTVCCISSDPHLDWFAGRGFSCVGLRTHSPRGWRRTHRSPARRRPRRGWAGGAGAIRDLPAMVPVATTGD